MLQILLCIKPPECELAWQNLEDVIENEWKEMLGDFYDSLRHIWPLSCAWKNEIRLGNISMRAKRAAKSTVRE